MIFAKYSGTRRTWTCGFGVAARILVPPGAISEGPRNSPPPQPRDPKTRPKAVPTIHEEGD
jgi:hypothetical protein